MGVLWKATTGIINRRLTAEIRYHDTVHGFCMGHGTGGATLEANLLQQLTDMREAVLHAIFLDLQKAYDALDRYRCIDILTVYGVGPRMLRLLRTYWDQLHMVVKIGGYFAPPLQGIPWGDPG